MKTRDISPTTPGTTTIRGKITDPDIASKPTAATPAAIAVGETSSGVPGALPAMDIPRPPIYTREAPSTVRGGLGGEDMPGIDMTGAPSSDPRYNPTATEYHAPPSNLPMQVAAAQVANESLERTYNVGPGDRSPLAGTVNDGFARLRRMGGGE